MYKYIYIYETAFFIGGFIEFACETGYLPGVAKIGQTLCSQAFELNSALFGTARLGLARPGFCASSTQLSWLAASA